MVVVLGFLAGMPCLPIAAQPTPDQRLFTEIAGAAGLDFVHFNGMSGELYMVEMMGGGTALLDYDRDGDLDVFLVQGAMLGAGKSIEEALMAPRHSLPLTGRLYRNDLASGPGGEPMLVFTDVTAAAVPASLGYGMGVAAADYDNDGWVDLYVTNYGSNQLLRNNGDGTYADMTATAGVGDERWSVSASFLDYDRDGRLDLFVGNYLDYSLGGRAKCAAVTGSPDYCSPLNFAPQPDRLFRNLGNGRFQDVSGSAGVTTEFGPALGVVAADFDGDGWLDVYVANDATENQLWMNQTDGTFANEAVLAGCAVNDTGIPEGSMGIAVADFDGNGALDLFMTHIAQETNTLYLNSGDGVFREATRRSRLGVSSRPLTGFGAVPIDFDNDGWQDLFVVNGTVQKIAALVAQGDPYPLRQQDSLYRNVGGVAFKKVEGHGEFDEPHVGRGLASGDLDLDGDDDLVVFDSAAPVRLLRNEQRSAGVWVGLRVGTGWDPFRDALGARVETRTSSGHLRVRRIATDGSYASASAPEVIFAEAGEATFDSITIEWALGGKTTWTELPAGRRITLVGNRRDAR